MSPTVLITGSSTGLGAAAARDFAARGWSVIATMRDPAKGADLARLPGITVLPLDVEDPASIKLAVDLALSRFGRIDALVNNAGFGQFGLFEAISPVAMRRQFEVNFFGALEVTRALLPQFRANRAGVIVNVSSGAGVIGFPAASAYCASKFALEGWSEALSYELASLGIRVKIIEPGAALKTGFQTRMGEESSGIAPIEDYLPFLQSIAPAYARMMEGAEEDAVEKIVAAIFAATTDGTDRLRYAPTADIQPLLSARRSMPDVAYEAFMRDVFLTSPTSA